MKHAWEYAVGGFFVLFVVGVAAFAVITLWDRNDLVTEHYYDAEIQYQQQIDRIDRTNGLVEQPSIALTSDGIRIQFPRQFHHSDLTGTVHVYRPDDKRLDLSLPVGVDTTNLQLIPAGLLSPGRWNVQVTWNGKGVGYYSEEKLAVR